MPCCIVHTAYCLLPGDTGTELAVHDGTTVPTRWTSSFSVSLCSPRGQTIGEAEGYRFGESEPAPVAGPTAPLVWLMAGGLVANLPARPSSCRARTRSAGAMPPVSARGADLALRARGALVRGSEAAGWPRSAHVKRALARLEGASRPHAVSESALVEDDGIGRAHFASRLHEETGLYFWQWRQAVTMRRAIGRIVGERTPLSEISWDVGFEHLSGFDRDFGQLFGISPSKFRRLCQVFGVRTTRRGATDK